MSNEQLLGLFKRIAEIGRIRVRSALYPILYLCLIVFIPFCGVIVWSAETIPIWIMIFLAIIVGGVIGTALFAYIYLLFKNPDRLQSEEYQLKRFSLELSQEKGDPAPVLETSIIPKSPERDLIQSLREKKEEEDNDQ